jgi:hypothetical protein
MSNYRALDLLNQRRHKRPDKRHPGRRRCIESLYNPPGKSQYGWFKSWLQPVPLRRPQGTGRRPAGKSLHGQRGDDEDRGGDARLNRPAVECLGGVSPALTGCYAKTLAEQGQTKSSPGLHTLDELIGIGRVVLWQGYELAEKRPG